DVGIIQAGVDTFKRAPGGSSSVDVAVGVGGDAGRVRDCGTELACPAERAVAVVGADEGARYVGVCFFERAAGGSNGVDVAVAVSGDPVSTFVAASAELSCPS